MLLLLSLVFGAVVAVVVVVHGPVDPGCQARVTFAASVSLGRCFGVELFTCQVRSVTLFVLEQRQGTLEGVRGKELTPPPDCFLERSCWFLWCALLCCYDKIRTRFAMIGKANRRSIDSKRYKARGIFPVTFFFFGAKGKQECAPVCMPWPRGADADRFGFT